ncbi:DUF6328 family protein [Ornithinimicrobium sp. Y1847]|uniref:DUF6328 family protein n=1 Tax=Ornithinimicrobium sp. Y1847 TaxID=3405419 RepID=UPI003B66CE5E
MDRIEGEDTRDESVDERMDRNFVELLQELRVVQTGTQILAAFLLTLPFQARFSDLDDYTVGLFLTCVGLAFLTTILLVAPVSVHRVLFRRHRKAELVAISHTFARAGLMTLGLTMAAVLCLVFTVVLGRPAGLIAAGTTALLFGLTWWVLPLWLRSRA